MKFHNMRMVFMLCMLTPLHGFSRYIAWLKNVFKQADVLDINYAQARSFLRSSAVYDHFATVVLVDALMISPAVFETYAHLYTARRKLPSSWYHNIVQKLSKQEEDYIAFYILITPAKPGPTLSATHSYAQWIVSLNIEHKSYQPSIVRYIRLEPEYQEIFGRHYSQFRDVYYVAFNVGKKERGRIINNTAPLELMFCSTHHTVLLAWF